MLEYLYGKSNLFTLAINEFTSLVIINPLVYYSAQNAFWPSFILWNLLEINSASNRFNASGSPFQAQFFFMPTLKQLT